VLKKIKNFFLRQELKNLDELEQRILEQRARLVHRPTLEEMPEKLEQCEKLGKQLKKIKKKKKKIKEKLGV